VSNKGTSSNNHNDDNDKSGDSHEPDVVPPDYASGEQKARERGRWVKEAILKGGISGAVRALIDEGFNSLG